MLLQPATAARESRGPSTKAKVVQLVVRHGRGKGVGQAAANRFVCPNATTKLWSGERGGRVTQVNITTWRARNALMCKKRLTTGDYGQRLLGTTTSLFCRVSARKDHQCRVEPRRKALVRKFCGAWHGISPQRTSDARKVSYMTRSRGVCATLYLTYSGINMLSRDVLQ